jgi:hypothetical protein
MATQNKTSVSPPSRVWVAVSEHMEEPRKSQRELNLFLWTSELAYGHFLHDAGKVFGDPDGRAAEVLAHVATAAWFPNQQGRIKYDQTVGQTLVQINKNTVHVYRLVILSFLSA